MHTPIDAQLAVDSTLIDMCKFDDTDDEQVLVEAQGVSEDVRKCAGPLMRPEGGARHDVARNERLTVRRLIQ